MEVKNFLTLTVLSVLVLVISCASNPAIVGKNPLYSSAGTHVFDTTPYFNTATTNLILTFTISFSSRTMPSTNYCFGYSIKQLTYIIANNIVNYTVEAGTKSATSVSMKLYTGTANKISKLEIGYIVIEPLFNLYDFQTYWAKPNRVISNAESWSQNFPAGPFSTAAQSMWYSIVGLDMVSNTGDGSFESNFVPLMLNRTAITIVINAGYASPFYVNSVVLIVVFYNTSLASTNLRKPTMSIQCKSDLTVLTRPEVDTYNIIAGLAGFAANAQTSIDYQWNISGTTVPFTVTATATFVDYRRCLMTMRFSSCPSATPYLVLSTQTCYDTVEPGYYLADYNELQSCPSQCLTCTSAVTCQSCVTNYVLVATSCILDCSVIADCILCTLVSTTLTCTSCIPGSTLSGNTCNTPQVCGDNIKTSLQACDDGNNDNGDGCSSTCTVQSGYYCSPSGSGSSVCSTCSSSISNCNACTYSSSVSCSSCVSGYTVSSNSCAQVCGNNIKTPGQACDDGNTNNGDGCSSTCTVQSGYYCTPSGTGSACSTCSSNINNCATCTYSSSVTCSTCNAGFALSGNSCSSSSTSTGSCGNGIIQSPETCDDGNTNSLDGCDKNCKIQDYYTCASSPSVCNLAAFSPPVASLSKSASSNQFTITYQLQPATTNIYSSLNWNSIVSQQSSLSINLVSSNYDTSNCKLSLTYSYTQALNDATLILRVTFPNSAPFQNVQGVLVSSTLNKQDKNLSLDVYTDSDYATANAIYITSLTLSACALFMFTLGFFGSKIVAIQMITVFQVAYISLTSFEKLTPFTYALTGLFFSFGYAFDFLSSETALNRYGALKLKILFFSNYNLSFLFVLLPLLGSLVLSIIASVKGHGGSSKLKNLSTLMRGQWLFYGLTFSLYIFVLSIGINFMQFSSSNYVEMLGLASAILLICGSFYMGIKILIKSQDLGQFIKSFRKNSCFSSGFYFLMVIERCLTAGALLIYKFNYLLVIIIGVVVLQMALIVIVRPYNIVAYTLRSMLNLTITLIILIIYLTIPNSSSPNYSSNAPFAILALLGLCLIYNIYYFYKAWHSKERQESEQNTDSNKLNDNQLQINERVKVQYMSALNQNSFQGIKVSESRRQQSKDELRTSPTKNKMKKTVRQPKPSLSRNQIIPFDSQNRLDQS